MAVDSTGHVAEAMFQSIERPQSPISISLSESFRSTAVIAHVHTKAPASRIRVTTQHPRTAAVSLLSLNGGSIICTY